ncbi:MAG: zinc ribbon domain-containing protein [Lachnoclostridium sp.]|nr:zinc ribbon domain-containing protein [Lachnospira sp.]MCM1247009.1 zinc ribbon domain-containing protein [Lachnoclostridium sp.]
MFCGNCGAKLEENATFCPQCGRAVVEKSESPNNTGASNQLFVSPDETLIATLGNGFAEDILYKKIKSCKALLTDKRVYFQGIFYSGAGKALSTQKEEMIVDLEDITGTKFRYSAFFWKKIIISILIPIILAVLYFVMDLDWFFPPDNAPKLLFLEIFSVIYAVLTYLKGRITYFAIEYAGGSICFNATIVGLADVRDFQKQMRRAKDALRGK